MSQKDFLEKDYYASLGVAKDADANAIKKAYRKLAKKHHPDANKGDLKAEERFKEVSEAYDVLSNDASRKEYDEVRAYGARGFGFPGGGGGAGGQSRPGGAGPQVDFSDLFGGGGGANFGGGLGDVLGGIFGRQRGAQQARRGADLESEVHIDFTDAVNGVTLPLSLRGEATCQHCRGTGAEPGTPINTCPTCNGSGQIVRNAGGFALPERCPTCHGRGQVIETRCSVCGGSGATMRTRTIKVRIPAGVKPGQRIRIPGKGQAGMNGAAPGDLYVIVHVSNHSVFGRKGDNLTITVPVSFPEATLGSQITVPTLDGSTVTLKVPAGTQNGRTFRVKGKGVHRANKSGDLLVTVEVAVPHNLNREAREALTAYAEATADHNPREHLVMEEAR